MTPLQMYALQHRRYGRHKRHIYYSGVVAATILNTKLSSDHAPISAYDFVPRIVDPQKEKQDNARRNLFGTFCLLSEKGLMPADISAFRTRTIQTMCDDGIDNPEEIFADVFESHDTSGNK